MWPTSTGHWSLYSQGQFYHLSAPGLVKNPTESTTSSGLDSMRFPVVLNMQDFSDPETEDSMTFRDHHKTLVAYHVGNNSYPADVIERIATWIIDQLQTYDFLQVNCHHFLLSLMYRTVMTTNDHSVFVGTAPQL